MRNLFFSLLLITLSLFITNISYGQRRQHHKAKRNGKTVVVVKKRTPRTLRTMPTKHTVIVHRNRKYHFHSGNYYRHINNRYVLVYPPRGFRVRTLPAGHRIVLVGGVKRYYYRGLFYKSVNNEYEVITPELGTIVPELPVEDLTPTIVDGNTIYEYNSIIYEPVIIEGKTQYRVTDIIEEETEE
ncbi:MAG: DUF6515 family protein [Flavobacteriales bacterium]|jgi:ribosomal protein L14|nr:DUF6515 family protein [Flavobacteriales bacterium]